MITDREERTELAQNLTHALAGWSLSKADQLRLLGMQPRNTRVIDRLAAGHPLPDSPDLIDRARLLIGIARTIAERHPDDDELRATWMTKPLHELRGRSPGAYIHHKGFLGLVEVTGILGVTRHLYRR